MENEIFIISSERGSDLLVMNKHKTSDSGQMEITDGGAVKNSVLVQS